MMDSCTISRPSLSNVLSCAYFLVGIFATMPILRIHDVSLFVWLVILLAIFSIFTGRLSVTHLSSPLFLLIIAAVASTLSALLNGLPAAYISNSVKALMMISAIWINIGCMISQQSNLSDSLIRGVAFGALCNSIWMLGQLFIWVVFGGDLNRIVFNQIFNITEVVSQYKNGALVATGLCWNAGGIAAALMVGYVFFKSPWVRLLLFTSALISKSRTLLIGMLILVAIDLTRLIFDRYRSASVKGKRVIRLSGFCAAAVGLIIAGTIIISRLSKLDSSGSAHLAYYLNLPALISRMNPFQLLVGYGVDCSGFPYSALTEQYHWLESWFVESDPVNTFLGMGLIGFVAVYLVLFNEARVLWDKRSDYWPLMIGFLICGVFYNLISVTYYWLLILIFSFRYERNENG